MKPIISFFKSLFSGDQKQTPTQDAPAQIAKPVPEKPLEAKTEPPVPKTEPGTEATPPPVKTPKKPKWSVRDFPVPPKEGETRFHDLKLPVNIMHAIADLNFQYCTPIQAKLLEHTLQGKDATAKAQTGTGKSASFIITILSAFTRKPMKIEKGHPRALILAPTRELVYQIEKDFKDLAKYSHLRIVSVYGGTGYKKQQDQLRQKPVHVIAATPGRLIDFMEKGLIHFSGIEIAVLDEADRMLDMGFIPDVRRIILKTPHKKNRQTLFFSATLTPEVERLAQSWTTESAVRIETDPEQAAAESIEQLVYITTEDDKFKNVFNLISSKQLERVLIFVNRKDTARRLSEKLGRYGQSCGILSGDVSQDRRFKVLGNFKDGRINLLVATDVAARGLHIEGISHVINYDLPQEPEHYIHRIGRTGRAGATGTSISFADEMSSFFIPQIEEVLGNKISCEYPTEEMEKELPKPIAKPKKTNARRPPQNRKKSYPNKKKPGRQPRRKPSR